MQSDLVGSEGSQECRSGATPTTDFQEDISGFVSQGKKIRKGSEYTGCLISHGTAVEPFFFKNLASCNLRKVNKCTIPGNV